MTRVDIDFIRVEGRHRRDLGDLETLAASMKAQGLINPVTITPDGRLLAGGRRIAAARMLGWTHIDARQVETFEDAAAALLIERDENTERKPMKPSELVSLGKALEALERPKADVRQGSRTDLRSSTSTPFGADVEEVQSLATDVVVARALGTSRTTYQRAKGVVDAASDPARTDEQRALAAEALSDMDAGRASISGAYERVRTNGPRTVRREAAPIDGLAAQRRAISSAEAALSGICHGLRQIEALHGEITSEEAARWVGSLLESRRAITVIINLLRERSNNGTA